MAAVSQGMYTVRVFDDAQEGHTSDGMLVASAYDPSACAILVSVLNTHATVRCGACEWPVWEYADGAEYRRASYDEIAGMIASRMVAHVHSTHTAGR